MIKRASISPTIDSFPISKHSDSNKDDNEDNQSVPLSPIYTSWSDIFKHWPLTTFCIVSNEFCERFSYYGMRTVLTLYLLNILKMSYDTSTIFFNGFTVLCYFTPLLGSILADGYIGKFRTIFFVSILYTIGQVVLAVSSVFNSQSSLHPWLDYLGLIIIGFGTGGIKPCVNSFGGEQFEQHQERMLSLFFSMFYFSINAGSMISTFISPIFRSLPCLGQDTCFPLAFGVPAALMIVATVVFMAGSFKYKKPKVKNNVFGEVWNVVKNALKNKFKKSSGKKDHWLDHYLTTHRCSSDEKCLKLQSEKKDSSLCQKCEFVDDIKQLFRLAIMFLPVPIFWALYDQQGSIWLIQSIQMDCRVGSILVLPDQMQTLNAVLILIFIPLFQVVVYPAIELCFKMTPLRKMVLGGVLATLAFVVSGIIQFEVNKTLPVLPKDNQAFVNFFNSLENCNISISPVDKSISQNSSGILQPYPSNGSLNYISSQFIIPSGSFHFKIDSSGSGCSKNIPLSFKGNFESKSVNYIVINKNGAYQQKVDPSKPTEGEGEFSLSIDIALNENYTTPNTTNLALCKLNVDNFDPKYPCDPNQSGSDFYYWERNYNQNTDDMVARPYQSSSPQSIVASSYVYKPVKPGKWGLYYMYNQPKDISHQTYSKKEVKVEATNITFFIHAQGGVYNLIVTGDKKKPEGRIYQFVKDNTVNILWQVPQYIIITAAEICFSVTGLEFAYSQAAPSMKALVQAMWLLTTAIGDTIIVAVAAAHLFDDLAIEFLAYGGLMLVVIIIFAFMSQFYYEYKNYGEDESSSGSDNWTMDINDGNEIKNHDISKVKLDSFNILSKMESTCKESINDNMYMKGSSSMSLSLNNSELEKKNIDEFGDNLSKNIINESLFEYSKLLSNIDNKNEQERSCDDVQSTENSSTSDSCRENKDHLVGKKFLAWKKKNIIMLMSTLIVIILKYLFYNFSLQAHSLISYRKQLTGSLFSNTSWIVDYSDGNGASIDKLLSQSEIAIIYYYAPWSKHSLINKKAYSNIGKLFENYENIKFYAVNCFESKGECRKSFKLYNFPIVTAHLKSRKYIQFLNDFNEVNLFKWLNHLLHPINRINDKEQLENYIEKYNSLVLGYFPIRSTSFYTEFIFRSYKESERENFVENNKFLITTNNSLINLIAGVNINTGVVFHFSKNFLNNSISKSTYLESVSSKEIMFNEWIEEKIKNIETPVRWINLGNPSYPIKNNEFYSIVNNSDVVVHFTNRNPFKWKDTPSIYKFKKIAVKYHNSCFKKIKTFTKNVDTNDYESMCKMNGLDKLQFDSCCIELKSEKNFCLNTSNNTYYKKNLEFCKKIMTFYSLEETKKMCCQLSGSLIKRQIEKSLNNEMICKYMDSHVHNFKKYYRKKYLLENDTIQCYKNESLQFYLAPIKYLEYMKEIWNIPKFYTDEFTILISKANDAIYYDKSFKFGSKTFVKMLQNYRTKEKIDILTKKETKTQKLTNNNNVKDIVSKLSMNEFLKVIKFTNIQSNEADRVILLSGGSSNGPSMAIMHIFHQLANYFLPFNKLIKFNIVDLTEIDVPYTMKTERIPALYFQSSKNLEQSSYYPKELPFTFPNIFAFIISRCQIELKWRIAITLCTKECLSKNKIELDKYNNKISDFIQKSQILQNNYNTEELNKVIEVKKMQKKLTTELSKFISELDEKYTLNFQQTILKWVLYNFKT
uniref:Oligopeptide transporter 1 n=1 Tax=Strongyloides stercoralis TaxID=6248 RepID=A0AAF5DMB3_STRER